MLCYIPRIIWRSLNVKSGLDLINLVDASIKYESVDKFGDREKIMAYIINNLERYIGARKSRYERLYGRKFCAIHKNNDLNQPSTTSNYLSSKQQLKNYHKNKPGSSISIFFRSFWLRIRIIFSTICFWTGKRLGNYLVVLYMFVKTLWLTNAVSQLFLLNRFIGNDYHAFGVEIIEMLLSGQEWHELRHFPRVTYCDFKIREIGNSHDWTVQCVLRINLFNEVIYIFMWFWLCILALFSIVDYISWTFRLLISADKLRFVKRHLDIYNFNLPSQQAQSNQADFLNGKISQSNNLNAKTSSESQEQLYNNNFANSKTINRHHQQQQQQNFEYIDIEKEKKLMREFTFTYLKDDGIFAMRILAASASDLIVTEIISEMWKSFKQNYVESTPDEMTLISTSSSSTSSSSSNNSSTNSSHQSSAASSPLPLTPNNASGSLRKQPIISSSPNSFIKKPFNYPQNGQSKQYSNMPQQQTNLNSPIYSNTNVNQAASTAVPLSNLSTNLTFNQNGGAGGKTSSNSPPPPIPQSNMPNLANTNENFSEENMTSVTKRHANFRENIYPPIQQRAINHEHSNANPDAKNTHV